MTETVLDMTERLKAQANAAYKARSFGGGHHALHHTRCIGRAQTVCVPLCMSACCCIHQAAARPHWTHYYTEAVDLYTRALELAPGDRALLSNRSTAHLAMGRINEAAADAQVRMSEPREAVAAEVRPYLLQLARTAHHRRADACSTQPLKARPAPVPSIPLLPAVRSGRHVGRAVMAQGMVPPRPRAGRCRAVDPGGRRPRARGSARGSRSHPCSLRCCCCPGRRWRQRPKARKREHFQRGGGTAAAGARPRRRARAAPRGAGGVAAPPRGLGGARRARGGGAARDGAAAGAGHGLSRVGGGGLGVAADLAARHGPLAASRR